MGAGEALDAGVVEEDFVNEYCSIGQKESGSDDPEPLGMTQVDLLAVDFEKIRHGKHWGGKWGAARARGNLRRELGWLSRRAAYGSQETQSAFVALAGDIARHFKEQWADEERPSRSACPLAAALTFRAFDLAEALWHNAPTLWWADGSALCAVARSTPANGLWTGRLLPCWSPGPESSSSQTNQSNRDIAMLLAHKLIKSRSERPKMADDRWVILAERMPASGAQCAALLAAQEGENFEDWGRMMLRHHPGQAGKVFEATAKESNSKMLLTPSRSCWSKDFLAELARSATRSELLFASIWSPANQRYADVAREELSLRGEEGIGRGDRDVASKALAECAHIARRYRNAAQDPSEAHALMLSVMANCSRIDLVAVADDVMRRNPSIWRRRWTWSLKGVAITREILPAHVEGVAKQMEALARNSAPELTETIRRLSGLNGAEFDHFFKGQKERLESISLSQACAQKSGEQACENSRPTRRAGRL